jgi:hypothetical protein
MLPLSLSFFLSLCRYLSLPLYIGNGASDATAVSDVAISMHLFLVLHSVLHFSLFGASLAGPPAARQEFTNI